MIEEFKTSFPKKFPMNTSTDWEVIIPVKPGESMNEALERLLQSKNITPSNISPNQTTPKQARELEKVEQELAKKRAELKQLEEDIAVKKLEVVVATPSQMKIMDVPSTPTPNVTTNGIGTAN